MSNNNVHGANKIIIEIIKIAKDELVKHVSRLIKFCLEKGKFLKDWK